MKSELVKTEIKTKDVYSLAVKYWGEQFQMDMMIEECCELIHAIMKYRRGKATIQDVAEECVDVQIMVSQMQVIVDSKYFRIPCLFSDLKDKKIARLKELLSHV